MNPSQPPNSDPEQPEERDLWRILQEDSATDEADAPPAASSASRVDVPSPPPPEAHEGITKIERILSDPESVEDTVDFRTTPQTDDDYDAAIRTFYRDTGTTVTCKEHPEVPSVDQCPLCEAYYCQDCMVVRRGKLICRTCAISEYVPSEEEILEAQEYGQGVQAEITPEEKPEFQVGSALLGLEGRPTHPLKRLVALGLDLLLTRLFVLILAAIAGGLLSHQPGAFFHLFDQVSGEPVLGRMYQAFVLLRPVVPWLIVFALADFLYLFATMSFFNRTLGMSWLSCRLVTEWGDFAGFGAVALRTLVFMVCLGWPAVVLAWFFPAYRGPHDYAAGTLVINYSGNKRVDSYDTVQIKLD